MYWFRGFAVVLSLLILASCNETSTSSSGSSSSSIVTETFTVDASAVEAAANEASLQAGAPGCEPEDAPQDTGRLMYRRDDTPTKLVVFAHGFGHRVEFSWLGHMRRTVRPGVAVIATNYRDNAGFPALRGAHDTIAATLLALEKFPTIEDIYLMGVSMGGAVSGTAIAEAQLLAGAGLLPDKPDGKTRAGLYDYWIDTEGVSQLAETWAGATAVGNATGNQFALDAAAGIERDMSGGTPADCLAAYQRRSPALNTLFMMMGELKAAAVVHAINDGLVPYNQGREMAVALRAGGIPTQMYTVLTTFFHPGTTLTGYATDPLEAEQELPDTLVEPAGHASEADPIHPVMRKSFAILDEMLNETYDAATLYKEGLVDDLLGEYDCSTEVEDCVAALQSASELNPEQIAALVLLLLAQQQ